MPEVIPAAARREAERYLREAVAISASDPESAIEYLRDLEGWARDWNDAINTEHKAEMAEEEARHRPRPNYAEVERYA